MQTAIKLELIKGRMKVDLDDSLRSVLFKIGKEIRLLKIDDDNIVIDINYEKYLDEIKLIIQEYLDKENL